MPRSDGSFPPRAAAIARRAASWLGWWVALFALWLALDDSVATDELLAGAAAAALAALLADAVSRQAAVSVRVGAGWLGLAARLPGKVAKETWVVFAALWAYLVHGREPRSGFVAEELTAGGRAAGTAAAGAGAGAGAVGDTPRDRTRRALLVGARSLAPNAFVLGVDAERGVMVVHKLVLGTGETEP